MRIRDEMIAEGPRLAERLLLQPGDIKLVLATTGSMFIGTQAIFLAAVELGAIATSYKLTVFVAGSIITAELAAISISSLLFAQIIKYLPRRSAALAAALAVILLYVICASVSLPLWLFVTLRIAAGIAAGVCGAIYFQIPVGSSNYVRVLSLSSILTAAGVLLTFLLLSYFAETANQLKILYIVSICVLSAAVVLVTFTPRGRFDHRNGATESVQRHYSKIKLTLYFMGVIAVNLGLSVAYSLAERLGSINGLPSTMIIAAIGWTTLTNIAGASLAAWMGYRFGLAAPILAAYLIQTVIGFMLVHGTMLFVFSAALGLCNFAFYMGTTFSSALLAKTDPTARLSATGGALTALSYSAGPLLGGALIDKVSYTAIGPATFVLCGAAILFSLPFALSIDPLKNWRRRREPARSYK